LQILIMSDAPHLAPEDVPAIPSRYRLQWEPAQNANVLLYPEGMVRLSESAAEILKCVDGISSVAAIVEKLEQAFPGADLRADVIEFLGTAYARGWITTQSR
jgi:pyrroloquinoline quinone biosynthesis protein D